MKKIIDGKIYNTETAIQLSHWSNGFGSRDFRDCEIDLWVTKKGQFFITGEGGPMSRWSKPCGNMTSGGSGLELVDKTEAMEIFESADNYIGPDDIEGDYEKIYERFFGLEEG